MQVNISCLQQFSEDFRNTSAYIIINLNEIPFILSSHQVIGALLIYTHTKMLKNREKKNFKFPSHAHPNFLISKYNPPPPFTLFIHLIMIVHLYAKTYKNMQTSQEKRQAEESSILVFCCRNAEWYSLIHETFWQCKQEEDAERKKVGLDLSVKT